MAEDFGVSEDFGMAAQGAEDFGEAEDFGAFGEEKPKDTVVNSLQDIARFFAPIATTGLSAIGTAVGAGLAGGDITEAAVAGAQAEEFLGMPLGMETTAGKFIEKNLSNAMEKMHSYLGDTAADFLKDDFKRQTLKGIPALAPFALIYEGVDQEKKTAMEASVAAAGASAPDLLLALIGGKAAKKAVTKEKLKPESIEDILAGEEFAEQPKPRVDEELTLVPKEEEIKPPITEAEPEIVSQRELVTPEEMESAFARLGEEEAGIRANVSGESAASMEAINRLRQQEEAGIKIFELDPERGDITPLVTAERVDKKAGQGKAIIQQDAEGNVTIIENNSRFGNVPLTNRSKSMLAQEAKQPLGGVGKAGFGQGGAIGFKQEPLTLEQKAKKLSQEDWSKEFASAYPEKTQFADQIYHRLKGPQAKGFEAGELVTKVTDALDVGLGAISTRLGNIHPELKQHLVDFEFNNTKNTGSRLDRVDEFLTDINTRFGKNDIATIDTLLRNNDYETLLKASPPELKTKINHLRSVLDETGEELKKYGIIENLRKDYFPRNVVDLNGLYKAMGRDQATELQRLIKEKEGRTGPLSDIELTDVTNRYIQGNYRQGGKPGFARGRKLGDIPPEFEPFYAKSAPALHSYLRSATFQIERAKFFGKNAVKDPETGRINVPESIGSYVSELLNEKKIKPEQVETVADIIQARFGPGQSQSNAFIQGAKDLVHISLLGDIGNAAMQLADAFVVATVDGIRPAIIGALPKALHGGKIKAKDFGLMNRLSDEFVSDRKTTKVANVTLKALSKVDEFTKDMVLNASYLAAQKAARKDLKNASLFYEYQKRFGAEFPQLLEDLKVGARTDLTDRFVISELANRQPIFKSEYSQAYLESPNVVRGAMTLTSFMLKTADFLRNRGINQIKEGNKAEGIKNIAKISLGLAAGNVAMDTIRDFIANRPIEEPELKTIAAALFNTFRLNEYFTEDIKKGAFGEAAGQLVVPPYKAFDPLTKDLVAIMDGNEDTKFTGKSIKYIPWIGDEIYGWSGYGQAARVKEEKKIQREKLKELTGGI